MQRRCLFIKFCERTQNVGRRNNIPICFYRPLKQYFHLGFTRKIALITVFTVLIKTRLWLTILCDAHNFPCVLHVTTISYSKEDSFRISIVAIGGGLESSSCATHPCNFALFLPVRSVLSHFDRNDIYYIRHTGYWPPSLGIDRASIGNEMYLVESNVIIGWFYPYFLTLVSGVRISAPFWQSFPWYFFVVSRLSMQVQWDFSELSSKSRDKIPGPSTSECKISHWFY